MAKEQTANGEPERAPYLKPRLVTFQVNPSLESTEIDPLPDLQGKDQETGIGWLECLGVVIGSIIGYFLAVLT